MAENSDDLRWICEQCYCACTPPGVVPPRHTGGGDENHTSCKKEPIPITRAARKAHIDAAIDVIRERHGIRRRR